MATPSGVKYDELALEFLRRLTGDEQVSTTVQPLLTGAFSDAFDFGSKITKRADWFATMFGATDTSDAGAAARIAEVLAGTLPSTWLSQISRAILDDDPGKPDAAALPRQPEPAPHDVVKDLVQRLQQLGGSNASSAILAVTTFSGLQQELWQMVGGMAPPTGSKWSPENVVRSVRKLILKWVKDVSTASLPGPRTKAVAAEIEAEIAGPLEERLSLAGTLSTAGFVMYGVDDLKDLLKPPSTAQVGIEVHQVLQEQYRRFRPTNVIVQESTVYFEGSSTPITKYALSDLNVQALYRARDWMLLSARKVLKGKRILLARETESSLRDDNLDLTIGAEWEIKPIRGAALGVAQEFAYRALFNFYAALQEDVPGIVLPIRGTPRGGWVTRDHLVSGVAPWWPEVGYWSVRVVGGGVTGFPAQTILVITLDPLPGLIMYFRYDLPAGAVYAFAQALQQLLNEYAKQFKKGLRVVVVVVVCAVLAVLAVLLVLGLILALIEVGAEIAAAFGAVAEVLGPILIMLGTKLGDIIELLRRLAEQIAPLTNTYGLNVHGVKSSSAGRITLRFAVNDGTPSDSVPCVSATFGMLRLENAPVQLIAALPGLFAAGFLIAGAIVMNRLPPNVA